MVTSNQKIRYDLEAAVSGEQDVAALARQLEGLADTLEGDLKTQAQASAQALRELGAKQGAIDNFVQLKTQAGDAAARLAEAQTAAQKLGRELSASTAPTRAQAGQLEKLRDTVRSAKTELQSKTTALENSRAALNRYGIGTANLAQSERSVRAAVAAARAEVASMAPAYNAAGAAAATSGQRQAQAARSVKGELAGLSQQLATLRNLAGVALGGTLVGSLAKDVAVTADEYSNLAARVKLATGEGEAFTQGMADVQRIAQSTNTELAATAMLYTRLVESGKDAGLSAKAAQTEAASLTEVINQSIQLSGASSQAAQAAVTQLIQGLQSGVLRGEEFNSVVEQSPRLARALADGLGVTIGQLREMSQQGQITADVLRQALGGQALQIQKEFDQLPPTIGRAMQSLSNAWTVYVGETDKATSSSRAVAEAIAALARNLDSIAGLLMDAGQAAAAFTALRLAQSFLAIGAAGNTAAAGIGAATVAMNGATASAAATGAAVAATAGRIATVLRTLRTFTLVGLLVNIKDIGEWLGVTAAKMAGYKDATDELAEADKRASIAAQESARMKAALAQEMAKVAEAARGLTPAASEMVSAFDSARTSGKGLAESLAEVTKNADLSEPKGINDFAIALRDLQRQGKATGEDVKQAMADALKGEDLERFEARARAAFFEVGDGAELLAIAMDGKLTAAVERTGLSFERLTTGMSAAARSALSDTQTIIDGLDRLQEQGADVALALTASIGRGIDTADSQQAFEALRLQVEEVRKVLGDPVADAFLAQIESKARDAAREVGGLGAALRQLGVTSDVELKAAAESTRLLYEQVRAAGGSAREQTEAFRKMAEAAIQSGDEAALAYARSQAAVQGFELATDTAGRTVVRSMAEARAAADAYRASLQGATADAQAHMGWLERLEARNKAVKSSLLRDAEGYAIDEQGNRIVQAVDNRSSVASRLEGMGLDAEQASRLAAQIYDQRGNYTPRSTGAYQEGDTLDALLSRLAQRSSPTAAVPVGRTVNVNLNTNGITRTVDTSEAGAKALIETLQAARLAAGR